MRKLIIILVLTQMFSTVLANDSLQQLSNKSVNKIADDVGMATIWFDKKSFRDAVTGNILKVSSYLHNDLEVAFSANKFELKDDLDDAEFLISVSFQKQGDDLVVFVKYRSVDEMNFKTIKEVVAIEKLPEGSLESTDKIITKSDREKILSSLENSEKQNEKIVQGIEKIGEGMDTLKKTGGLIVDPKTPKEFYNNAKVYEIQGDQKNAMKMYEKYFRKSKNYVDPYESYISILKDREGRTGTIEILEEMLDEEPENLSLQYAFALAQTKKKKRKLLSKIIKDNPKFAPAYERLADTYKKDTLNEKKSAYENLEIFLELSKSGKFTKYFLDRKLVKKRTDIALERYDFLKDIAKKLKNPIKVDKLTLRTSQAVVYGLKSKEKVFFNQGKNSEAKAFIDISFKPELGSVVVKDIEYKLLPSKTSTLVGYKPGTVRWDVIDEGIYVEGSNNHQYAAILSDNYDEQLKFLVRFTYSDTDEKSQEYEVALKLSELFQGWQKNILKGIEEKNAFYRKQIEQEKKKAEKTNSAELEKIALINQSKILIFTNNLQLESTLDASLIKNMDFITDENILIKNIETIKYDMFIFDYRWNGINSSKIIELFKQACNQIKKQQTAKCIGVSPLFSQYKEIVDKNYWEQLNKKVILKKFPEWLKQSSITTATSSTSIDTSKSDSNYLFGLDNNKFAKYRSVKDRLKQEIHKDYIDLSKLLSQIKSNKPKNIILVTNNFRFKEGDSTDNKVTSVLKQVDKHINVILVGASHISTILVEKYKSLGLDATSNEYTVKNLLK